MLRENKNMRKMEVVGKPAHNVVLKGERRMSNRIKLSVLSDAIRKLSDVRTEKRRPLYLAIETSLVA